MIHFDLDTQGGARSSLALGWLVHGPLALRGSPEFQQRVRDMQEESAIELSNQSKERALVGEVI